MKFKYHSEMQNLSVVCPPEDFESRKIEAFRWAFDELNDKRNFLPLAVQNPQRVLDFSDKDKCQSLGLSMFNSLEKALARFLFFKKTRGDGVFEILGTGVAEGSIQANDGVSGFPDERGHFTFHPSEAFNFVERFVFTTKI